MLEHMHDLQRISQFKPLIHIEVTKGFEFEGYERKHFSKENWSSTALGRKWAFILAEGFQWGTSQYLTCHLQLEDLVVCCLFIPVQSTSWFTLASCSNGKARKNFLSCTWLVPSENAWISLQKPGGKSWLYWS